VKYAAERFGLSKRRGCRLVDLARGTFAYRPQPRPDEEAIRRRMREIAEKRRSWGAPHIHRVLRREGLVRNHKRTERIYREEKLSLRTRKKTKRAGHLRVEMPEPENVNERWSMDFVQDRIWQGRRFRIFTIVDDSAPNERAARRFSAGRRAAFFLPALAQPGPFPFPLGLPGLFLHPLASPSPAGGMW
jgi:putative transposase